MENYEALLIFVDDFYMIFEYMDHDLTGILNHPSFKLSLGNIKHLAQQFFEGIAYLHHRGILHRDIKGSNILLNNDGVLKIADFGLARKYNKLRKDLDYTNRIITLWYRPPEVLLGETVYGAEVDIWSAGCVLVEMFTRKAIFPGRTEIDQLDSIYGILGTPTLEDWPGFRKMPWFQLLIPIKIQPSIFDQKFVEALPEDAMNLVHQLFKYDPTKRPTAAQVLEHQYFINEPNPEPCITIRDITGDWHEYESKAHRKKKQAKEHEQKKAQQQQQAGGSQSGGGSKTQEQRRQA